MCLSSIDYTTDTTPIRGYKVFVQPFYNEKSLHAPFQGFKYPLDKWITDPNTFPIEMITNFRNKRQTYQPGFHVFFSINGAWQFRNTIIHFSAPVIIKVRMRKIRESGLQNRHKVLVAGQIYIDSKSRRIYTLEDM